MYCPGESLARYRFLLSLGMGADGASGLALELLEHNNPSSACMMMVAIDSRNSNDDKRIVCACVFIDTATFASAGSMKLFV